MEGIGLGSMRKERVGVEDVADLVELVYGEGVKWVLRGGREVNAVARGGGGYGFVFFQVVVVGGRLNMDLRSGLFCLEAIFGDAP